MAAGRGKGGIICAPVFIGVILVLGVCLASVSVWNPSAGFFPQNCLYTFLSELQIAGSTATCSEVLRSGLSDELVSASRFWAGTYLNLKLLEDRGESVPHLGTGGVIFEKTEPNGADMVSRE
jgi:hypothetical protein